MNYLVNLFKNKLIYFALLYVFVILAVYKSLYFLTIAFLISALFFLKRQSRIVVLTSVLFTLATFVYVKTSFTIPQQLQGGETIEGIYTIKGQPKINGQTMRGFLYNKDQEHKIYFSYTFTTPDEKAFFEKRSLHGAKVHVKGSGETIDVAHNYSFNMANYLQSQYAIGPFKLEVIQLIGVDQSLISTVAKQRFSMQKFIEAHFPKSLQSEAEALLIGVQENVEPELERAYQKLGITHLFAISGLHIALLSLFIYELMIRLSIRREVASVILFLILPLYALLAGGAPSVWRAVMMVELVMLLTFFNLKWPIDDVLSICCISFLIFSPHALFEIGFQLSYLATYGIIYSRSIIERATNIWLQNFYLTFVSQIITYPLLLLHFYELSLSSFFANIIFVPLFSFVILPINLILVVLSAIAPPIAAFFFAFYEPIRSLLNHVILFLQAIPYQMWVPGKPSVVWLIFLYCSSLIALYLLDVQAKWKSIFIVLCIPALLFEFRYVVDQNVYVTFLNVGQGDSIVIQTARNKEVILIDTGGLLRFKTETWKERDQPYEVGRQVVVPFLKGLGIEKVDKMILSHADADHVEGAEEVLKEIRVKEIHISPNSLSDPSMKELLFEAKKQRVRFIEKKAGDQFFVGNVAFYYLSPNDSHYEGNNDSLVLLMRLKAASLLFTGDLEKEGEQLLVKNYPSLTRNITVLKAGHHGSKTSSSEVFLKHTNPSLTIFTAGKNNRYNHPAKEVLERMESLGKLYVVTGIDGTIRLEITNDSIQQKK